MEFFKYRIADDETAQTFINRVCQKHFKSEKEIKVLQQSVNVFEKVRYSNEDITLGERKRVEAAVRLVNTRMWNDFGKWRYFYNRSKLLFKK